MHINSNKPKSLLNVTYSNAESIACKVALKVRQVKVLETTCRPPKL
jgi:hypothetical protein